jgi:hypothetical protein
VYSPPSHLPPCHSNSFKGVINVPAAVTGPRNKQRDGSRPSKSRCRRLLLLCVSPLLWGRRRVGEARPTNSGERKRRRSRWPLTAGATSFLLITHQLLLIISIFFPLSNFVAEANFSFFLSSIRYRFLAFLTIFLASFRLLQPLIDPFAAANKVGSQLKVNQA